MPKEQGGSGVQQAWTFDVTVSNKKMPKILSRSFWFAMRDFVAFDFSRLGLTCLCCSVWRDYCIGEARSSRDANGCRRQQDSDKAHAYSPAGMV
jgi:hypothetical protein